MTTGDNGFSNKEILLSLDKKVDEGFEKLEKLINEGHTDHEKRIRKAEATIARLYGMAAFIVVSLPLVVTLSVYHKI